MELSANVEEAKQELIDTDYLSKVERKVPLIFYYLKKIFNAMTEIRDQFLNIITENLKSFESEDVLDWDAELKFLGLDSISSINIIMAIEDELGVEIPDEYLNEETFKTANTLFNVVLSLK